MTHLSNIQKIKTFSRCIVLCVIFASNFTFCSETKVGYATGTDKSMFSVSTQYPKISAAGIAATLYFVPIGLGFKSKELAARVALCGGLISFILIFRHKNSASYLLENDPIKLQQKNKSVMELIFKDIENVLSLQNFQVLINKGEGIVPIFLLKECDHFSCDFLVRETNPQYRKTFEDCIVQGMIDQKKNNLCWVSFGCGGLFQDLIIAHKMLRKKPSQSLIIHFIDKNFMLLSLFLNYIHKEDVAFDNNEIDQTALESVFKEKNITNLEQIKEVFNGIMLPYFQVRQYILFLQKMHKNAHIKCYIHASVENYLNDKKTKSFFVPDIVTTADIMDDNFFVDAAPGPYITLCRAVFKENPRSFHLWLDKSKGKVFLKTLSLNKDQLAEGSDYSDISRFITKKVLNSK